MSIVSKVERALGLKKKPPRRSSRKRKANGQFKKKK